MLMVGKKMNPQATSWGWFCVWLKDLNGDSFEIHDNKDTAEIKRFNLDKDGKPAKGYLWGTELEKCLHNYYIEYCVHNHFYNTFKDIGYEKFRQAIEDSWNNMMKVITVKEYSLEIKKY